MQNIYPFPFGVIIQQVFNSRVYNPEVIDITEQTLHSHFLEDVRMLPVFADWLLDCCIIGTLYCRWVQEGPGIICGD